MSRVWAVLLVSGFAAACAAWLSDIGAKIFTPYESLYGGRKNLRLMSDPPAARTVAWAGLKAGTQRKRPVNGGGNRPGETQLLQHTLTIRDYIGSDSITKDLEVSTCL